MANSEEIIYVNMNIDGVKTPVEELEKELLVLRLAFGKLRAAVKRALAPLGVAFIPMVQKAVWAATRLTNAVGKVIAALFRQGKTAQNTAKQQTALAKANDKVNRSLADFDELDRLETTDSSMIDLEETGALSPQLQAIVDKILSLIAPLQNVDFSAAVAAFGRLREAIAPISQALFSGLEWAWHNLLVPLAAWSVEHLLPAFLDALAASLGVLHAVIVALQPLGSWLWENFLQPLGQWAGEQIIATLGWLTERLEGISKWVSENQELVQKITVAAGVIALINSLLGSFNGLSGKAIGAMGGFGNGMGMLSGPMSLVTGGMKLLIAAIALLILNWDKVKAVAVNAWDSIRSAWSGVAGWFQKNLLTPLSEGFKNTVNGILGFFNGLIAGAVGAINAIARAVNTLQFTVPEWVPGIGGKTLGFDLKELQTPQIPYLAQGAVIPANKPFMAVLGDQKRGTNIEAPLDTIKQALAEVMAMQAGGGETVVNVNFSGDLAQLARVLKPVIDTENRRKGNSLAIGGVL